MVHFLTEPGKNETCETFCVHKYVNILTIVDIAAVLYVFCNYLFAVSLDNLFVLYVFFVSLANYNIN